MSYCPVCNGMSESHYSCSSCQADMVDWGKVTDYEDTYGPYMGIEKEEKDCIHLYYCAACQNDCHVNIHCEE